MPGQAMEGAVKAANTPPTREEVEASVAELKEKQRQDRAKDAKHELTEIEQLRLDNARLKMEALMMRKMALEEETKEATAAILERLGLPEDTQLMIDNSTEPWTVRALPGQEEG